MARKAKLERKAMVSNMGPPARMSREARKPHTAKAAEGVVQRGQDRQDGQGGRGGSGGPGGQRGQHGRGGQGGQPSGQ